MTPRFGRLTAGLEPRSASKSSSVPVPRTPWAANDRRRLCRHEKRPAFGCPPAKAVLIRRPGQSSVPGGTERVCAAGTFPTRPRRRGAGVSGVAGSKTNFSVVAAPVVAPGLSFAVAHLAKREAGLKSSLVGRCRRRPAGFDDVFDLRRLERLPVHLGGDITVEVLRAGCRQGACRADRAASASRPASSRHPHGRQRQRCARRWTASRTGGTRLDRGSSRSAAV